MKLLRYIALVVILMSNLLSVEAVLAMHDETHHMPVTQDVACQAHCLAASQSTSRDLNLAPTIKSSKVPVISPFSLAPTIQASIKISPTRLHFFDTEQSLRRTVRSIVLRT